MGTIGLAPYVLGVMPPRATGCLIGLLCLGAFILGAAAGCARSEHPLSSPEDGFIDPYLPGTWYEVSIHSDGTIDTPLDSIYEVTAGDDGKLQVVGLKKRGSANVYSAFSTRLGADKFLNLRDEECRNCGDLAAAAAQSDECPYHILQYTTYVPEEVTSEFRNLEDAGFPAPKLEAWMDRMRGQLLFYRGLLVEPVNEAIARGEIQGDDVILDPFVTTCIRSAGDALSAFVIASSKDDSAFSEWAILMRTSLRGETRDGIAINTPRQALITELLEGGCRGPETIIRESADEIVTLGYAESTRDYRLKKFDFEDGRLAEIPYAPPDLASPFAHAAQQLTRRSHLEEGSYSSRAWVPDDDSAEGSHYLPLLECIKTLEADEHQPAGSDEATELLTACMCDKGWGLAKSTGTTAPVCKVMEP